MTVATVIAGQVKHIRTTVFWVKPEPSRSASAGEKDKKKAEHVLYKAYGTSLSSRIRTSDRKNIMTGFATSHRYNLALYQLSY